MPPRPAEGSLARRGLGRSRDFAAPSPVIHRGKGGRAEPRWREGHVAFPATQGSIGLVRPCRRACRRACRNSMNVPRRTFLHLATRSAAHQCYSLQETQFQSPARWSTGGRHLSRSPSHGGTSLISGANRCRVYRSRKGKPPGKVNFASAGNGSAADVSAELCKMMAGVDMVHVAY
jgi:hypothetical protein